MTIKINPKEVESIEIIGELNGDDVKVVKTKGGYYCAIGKKKPKSSLSEPLAAGSHIAIVSHQVNQMYGDFKPSLNKNEQDNITLVDLTFKLSPFLTEKGHNLFSLQKDEKINFIVEKYGIPVLNLEGNVSLSGVDGLKAILAKKTDDIEVICKELSEII